MRTTRLSALIAVAVAGCADRPGLDLLPQELAKDQDTGDPVYPDVSGGGNGGNDGQLECRTITISGSMFYNDLRKTGRFPDRFDTANHAGTPDPYTANPVASSSTVPGDNKNYLGLRDAVVDLYEVDDDTTGEGCLATEYVGGVTIDAHGGFSWTGQVCDACDADHDGANDNGVSIAGRVRLRFCNDTRCFSVRDPLGMPTASEHYQDTFDVENPYRRWLREASESSPQVFVARTTATLAPDYFQNSASTSAGDPGDLAAQAANVYASLVDTTRRLHVDLGVAYDRDRFGEVQVFYPSVIGGPNGGGAHSHQPEFKHTSRLCIESAFDGYWVDPPPIKWSTLDPPPYYVEDAYDARHPDAWFDGSVVAHEYGHLVHYWQWEGFGKWASFCYQDAACDEGGAPESKQAAFKEGWANFIRHVVWDGLTHGEGAGCDNRDGDEPKGAPWPTPPATSSSLATVGQRWIDDVDQSLCDLWDGSSDQHTYGGVTYTDNAHVSLPDLVDALGDMWALASTAERAEVMGATAFGPDDTSNTPLGLCRYVADHPGNSTWVAALEVSGIDCGL